MKFNKMGIAFAIVGIMLIVTAAQNTYAQLGAQLSADLTGPNNFTYWFAALLFVGILGYIPALKAFSTWFMALILLALLLSHKGVFANITAALASGPVSPGGNTPHVTQSTGQTPTLTPQQGIRQGAAGVGVDWLTPIKKLLSDMFVAGPAIQ